MKPKQIVIDKSAFDGTKLDDLCALAKNHFLLLPDTLLYECVTTKKRMPNALLQRYETLMKAGAYYCSMSRKLVEWECRHCEPYPWLLADLIETNSVSDGRRKIDDLLAPEITDRARGEQCSFAERLLLGLSEEAKQRMDMVDRDLGSQLGDFPADTFSRLKKLLDEVSLNIHDMAVRSFPQWIRDPTRFCLSDAWMTWHYIRLCAASTANYTYLRQKGGHPGRHRAEHDLQDTEYVLLLSRADAIITRDKKLVEPLARAAFPEKDVFSSLEEVPDSYRCDWAEG